MTQLGKYPGKWNKIVHCLKCKEAQPLKRWDESIDEFVCKKCGWQLSKLGTWFDGKTLQDYLGY